MIKPKVSVITVVFNEEHAIEETLRSVIRQTYSNKEYIVIDGGSKDKTVDIIKKYQTNIDYWVSETDGGIYYGMNKGVAQVHGDWVLFINAGDKLASDHVLEDVFGNKVYNESIHIIYGNIIYHYPDYDFLIDCKPIKKEFQNLHPATFCRANDIKDYPFDTSFRIAADTYFFTTVKKMYGFSSFLHFPITISIFEAFSGVSNRNLYNMYKEHLRALQRKKNIRNYLALFRLWIVSKIYRKRGSMAVLNWIYQKNFRNPRYSIWKKNI